MDETRLGTILLESRIVAENDLEKCLEIQELTGGSRPLGQILVEQGLIDQVGLDKLLQLQQTRMRERKTKLLDSEEPLLDAVIRLGASDLVVSEGRPAMARVADDWRKLTAEPLSGPQVWDFVRDEMGPEVLEELADRCYVSRDLARPGKCRGRITAFRHFDGVAIVGRLHPLAIRTPEQLGLPPALLDLVDGGRGLLLLVGERGSGRTELLASIVERAAKDAGRYVLVIDDNAEYPTPAGGAMLQRRRVGEHVADYVTAMRTAIHEDPDVIIVGEVGEPAAFDLAMRAAESGRLVIACLHAGGVVPGLTRALNFYPTYDIARVRATLAGVLRAVHVHHLLPDLEHNALVPASELLLVDDAVREVLRTGDLANIGLLMRMDNGKNGHSLDHSLFDLVGEGRVRFEDVFGRAEEKAWVLERLRAVVGKES
jgi:twitching motility protein PilT